MYNNPYNNYKKQGVIRTILIVVVAVIILSMLGFDLQKIIASDLVQKNFSYLREAVTWLWNSYLAAPLRFLWNAVREILEKNNAGGGVPQAIPSS